MLNDELIIYVSSRNNYDMLEGEVFNNIDTEGFEFINVDDCSCEEEVIKGKKICESKGVVFLQNKGRGVQMSTQTLIDFINKERPNCKWIFCFQHDNYPITKNFFKTLRGYILSGSLDDIGSVGFNQLDYGEYTNDSFERYTKGEFVLGMMGSMHLSMKNGSRWLCPRDNQTILNHKGWKTPYVIEFPMWSAVGINVRLWNTSIKPTEDYQFHLWFPDVSMQFAVKNFPCVMIPKLYCFNHQALKGKYGIGVKSARGAMQGNEYHFGKYSNFSAWKSRWGWDFEKVEATFNGTRDKYKNTLIWDFYHHDLRNGPLKNISLYLS